MNLQPVITKPSVFSFRLRCKTCGKWHEAEDMRADIDGTPFEDYYCAHCAETVKGQS